MLSLFLNVSFMFSSYKVALGSGDSYTISLPACRNTSLRSSLSSGKVPISRYYTVPLYYSPSSNPPTVVIRASRPYIGYS